MISCSTPGKSGCYKLAEARIAKVFGPATREQCLKYVQGQIKHGAQGECWVGAKEDPTGGPYGMKGQPCGDVLGKWKWFTGGEYTFTSDGRVNGDPGIIWSCAGQNPLA